jgi:hypothetical protein
VPAKDLGSDLFQVHRESRYAIAHDGCLQHPVVVQWFQTVDGAIEQIR